MTKKSQPVVPRMPDENPPAYLCNECWFYEPDQPDHGACYGVDTGCLADALGAHNLDYQQGRHGNHRSGFAVLTFRDGQLLMPEIAMKFDEDSFEFRGHILHADTGAVL